jgi:transposase
MHRPSRRRVRSVLIADAQKVKGLALLVCKADRLDAGVLAEPSWRDLVPAISLPDASIRGEREFARFRLHLVRHRTALENRGHCPRHADADRDAAVAESLS